MHHPKHNLCPLDKHVVEWCLTRLTSVQRKDGTLEFEHKMGQNTAPTDFKAWFLHENRLLADTDIFFGHWSTLSNTMNVESGRHSPAVVVPVQPWRI
jgi:bis(5'-nucleosyl)-tetraphosphatase (symmetrical)